MEGHDWHIFLHILSKQRDNASKVHCLSLLSDEQSISTVSGNIQLRLRYVLSYVIFYAESDIFNQETDTNLLFQVILGRFKNTFISREYFNINYCCNIVKLKYILTFNTFHSNICQFSTAQMIVSFRFTPEEGKPSATFTFFQHISWTKCRYTRCFCQPNDSKLS